jgi:hypothetical protein
VVFQQYLGRDLVEEIRAEQLSSRERFSVTGWHKNHQPIYFPVGYPLKGFYQLFGVPVELVLREYQLDVFPKR